jgi:hypothetical protein
MAKRGNPQWVKGVSGNPAAMWPKGVSGNPKGGGWVREIARGYTKLAIKTLVELCGKGKTDSVRRAAAADLLERGWGKPLQQVEITRTPFDEMTADELRALERALANLEAEEARAPGEPQGTPVAAAPQRLSAVH